MEKTSDIESAQDPVPTFMDESMSNFGNNGQDSDENETSMRTLHTMNN